MPSEKFGRKVLITGVAHDPRVTLTMARQQTNTPNTHTLSPLIGAWFMVWDFCRAIIGSQIKDEEVPTVRITQKSKNVAPLEAVAMLGGSPNHVGTQTGNIH